MNTLALLITSASLLFGPTTDIDFDLGTSGKLHNAAKSGDATEIIWLIDKGADINEPDTYNFTPLMYAVQKGDLDIVSALLNDGANPNRRNIAGATALMIAARHGHNDILTELLRHGADPKMKNDIGETALDIAQLHRKHRSARLLARAARAN
jgi:ankyrin repeat protein